MGNLNFQVLGEIDEFQLHGKTDDFLKNFKEGDLGFPPTVENAGWPDRILFSEKVPQQMVPLLYTSVESNLSAHKPVMALFDARVCTVRVEEKARIE